MIVGTNYVGTFSTGLNPASGIMDEFRMYQGIAMPTLAAFGGLTTSLSEYLGTGSRNLSLWTSGVDPQRRGQYLYLGSDSKFRGLNMPSRRRASSRARATSTGSTGTGRPGPTSKRWRASRTRPHRSRRREASSGTPIPRGGRPIPSTAGPTSSTSAWGARRGGPTRPNPSSPPSRRTSCSSSTPATSRRTSPSR
jgi:hypothetical protein